MDGYVNKSTFARIYGCRASYVTQLNREGKLVLDESGALVNVEASFRLIEATRDLSKLGVRERWAAYRAGGTLEGPAATRAALASPPVAVPSAPRGDAARVGASEASPSTPANGGAGAYHEARTARESAEARLKELELRRALNEVAEVAPMVKAIEGVIGDAHRALREMPDRLAGQLAAESDPHKCYELLLGEVERIARALEQQSLAAVRQGATVQ